MKIPPQAKRVFKGVIFDVYQWEQEMFDGSKEVFEMVKRPDTVVVIATKGGKIVVAEQEQPNKPKFWSLLGGRCEEGEEPLKAAQRELMEESGLAAKDWELWRVYQPGSKTDWTLHYYIARNCEQVAAPSLDAGEKISVMLASFEEFIELVCNQQFGDRELSIDVLKMRLNPVALEQFRDALFRK